MTVCALIWGASLVVVTGALDSTGSLTFIWFRFLLVSVFAFPLGLYVLFKRVFTSKQLLLFLLIECTNIIAMWFAFRGLIATNTLYTAFFMELRPLFVTLGGILFLKEREDTHEWIGLSIAIIGSLVIVLSPLLAISKLSALALVPGIALLISSNLFNMVDILSIKKNYHDLPKLALLSIVALIDFLITSVLMFATKTPISFQTLAQPSVILPTLYMALFVSIIASGLLFFSLDRIEASEAILFNYLKPLVYVPLAFFVLREKPTLIQLIGLAFIMIGFFIANRKKVTEKKTLVGNKILKHSHHRL